ncbi:hypothetical protein B0H16DRAFT_1548835 [Mycena metata]|uniref:Uncharacterized protein n=1 Tax=Mycena metata TaxID=1033252 RepID=A0AAD7IX21_9AGAR|nr:hypothetical protein B0H16DRAFT_1548835 [Mycena metata]
MPPRIRVYRCPQCPAGSSPCTKHRPFLLTVFWVLHLTAKPRTYIYHRNEPVLCPLGCIKKWDVTVPLGTVIKHVEGHDIVFATTTNPNIDDTENANVCDTLRSDLPVPPEESYDSLKAELTASTSPPLRPHSGLPKIIYNKLMWPVRTGMPRDKPKIASKHGASEEKEGVTSSDAQGVVAGRKRKISPRGNSSEEDEDAPLLPMVRKRRIIPRVLSEDESDIPSPRVPQGKSTPKGSQKDGVIVTPLWIRSGVHTAQNPQTPSRSGPSVPQGLIVTPDSLHSWTKTGISGAKNVTLSPTPTVPSLSFGGLHSQDVETAAGGDADDTMDSHDPDPSFANSFGSHSPYMPPASPNFDGGDCPSGLHDKEPSMHYTPQDEPFQMDDDQHISSGGGEQEPEGPDSLEPSMHHKPQDELFQMDNELMDDDQHTFSGGEEQEPDGLVSLEPLTHPTSQDEPVQSKELADRKASSAGGEEPEGLDSLAPMHPPQDVQAKEVPHRPASGDEGEPEDLSRGLSIHPPQDVQAKEVFAQPEQAFSRGRDEELGALNPREPSMDPPMQVNEIPDQHFSEEEPEDEPILYCDSVECDRVELTDEHIWDHGHRVAFTHLYSIDEKHASIGKMFRCYPDFKYHCICGSRFGAMSEAKAHLDALKGNNGNHPRTWKNTTMKGKTVPRSRPV